MAAGYAPTCPVDKTSNRFACEHHGIEVSAKQERERSESSQNRPATAKASSAAMAAGRMKERVAEDKLGAERREKASTSEQGWARGQCGLGRAWT